MADKTITQLAAAGALAGTETLPIWQDGATKKVTAQDIANLAAGGVSSVNGEMGAVVLDATEVDVDALVPANYTPANASIEGHLTGIDTVLAAIGPAAVTTVNGQSGTVVLDATHLDVAHTPVNYSAGTASIEDNIVGLDAALNGSVRKLATFADPSGTLTSCDHIGISADGGLDIYKQDFRTEPLTPSYYNFHLIGHNIEPTENMINEFYQVQNINIQFDTQATGFNYGDNSPANGGIGLFNSGFTTQSESHIGRINYDIRNINLGQTGETGSCGPISCFSQQVRLYEDYSTENIQGVQFSLELPDANTSVNGFLGFQARANVGANAEILSYCNLYQANLTNEGDVSNVNEIDVTINGAGDYEYVNQLNLNCDIDGSCLGFNSLNIYAGGEAEHGNVNLINANFDIEGAVDGVALINAFCRNSVDTAGGISGVNVNMGSYDTTLQRRACFSGNGGLINNFAEISTLPNMFVDQGNGFINLFRVTAGSPITGTSFLSNSFATLFDIQDDIDAGLLGFGIASIISGGQISVASGKTAALLNCNLSGVSINDDTSTGGTIDKFNCYSAAGVLNIGGPNNCVINELRGFTMFEQSLGTALWGVDIQNASAENHFAKSIVIGVNNTVANNDIALELADKKALKLTGLTIAERDALTPLLGMVVLVDDTGIKELQTYNGTAWVRQLQYVAVPPTASSPGEPGQVAVEAGFFYTCVATNTWERVPTATF